MATFDFHRVTAGVNSDAALKMVTNYSAFKLLPISGADDTDFILSAASSTKWKFHGEDFDYSSKGDPKKGIIHSITVTAPAGHPELTFKISDVSIDIAAVKAAFLTSSNLDNLALLANIFGGDDTFLGSRGNDKFYGLEGNDSISGSSGKDTLLGGNGNDTLAGGQHVDKLTGGLGLDAFTFSTAIGDNVNIDVITDFNPTDDTIQLDDATIYQGLGAPGVLDASLFHVGNVGGANKDGGIIYDANGDLWYDVAGRKAYIFAHLNGTPTLTNEDFVIV